MSSPNILGEPAQAPQKREFPWAIAIGAILVLVAIGVAVVVMRPAGQGDKKAPPPYAASVKLADIKMATANNYVGGQVTYLEGTIQNAGNQTLTGATVEATFLNDMNQVVQREMLPVMIAQERPGYSDNVPLARAPLAAGKQAAFRITLEHVSGDWNGAYPQVRIADVQTQ